MHEVHHKNALTNRIIAYKNRKIYKINKFFIIPTSSIK